MKNWLKEKYEKQYIIFYKRRPVRLPSLVLQKAEEISDATFEGVRTVAPFIGPYRNLTTLVSLLLYFHPNVHVLNHADQWVLDYPKYNFLKDPTAEKMRNFQIFALSHYHSGKRDYWHRYITRSHAISDPARAIPRNLLIRRFGLEIDKQDIRSIIWKGALNTTNLLLEQEADMGELFSAYPKLRFIMPIRNPLDCALSNHRIRNRKVTVQVDTLEETLAEIMRLFDWGLRLQRDFPDRVFAFYQNDIDAAKLSELAKFLEIPADRRWVKDFLHLYRLGEAKSHDNQFTGYYEQLVGKLLSWSPSNQEKMLAFISQPQTA